MSLETKSSLAERAAKVMGWPALVHDGYGFLHPNAPESRRPYYFDPEHDMNHAKEFADKVCGERGWGWRIYADEGETEVEIIEYGSEQTTWSKSRNDTNRASCLTAAVLRAVEGGDDA